MVRSPSRAWRTRTCASLIGTAALVLTAGTTATAGGPPPPEHGTIVETAEFDDNEYCVAEGVPSFHVVETRTLDFVVYFNADGSFRSATIHQHQEVVFTANGKILQENDHWTNFFYPDGTAVTVGAHGHIQGDTGIVLRDAGRIVLDVDGNVTFMAGPHPQFSGETFCEDLLP